MDPEYLLLPAILSFRTAVISQVIYTVQRLYSFLLAEAVDICILSDLAKPGKYIGVIPEILYLLQGFEKSLLCYFRRNGFAGTQPESEGKHSGEVLFVQQFYFEQYVTSSYV